MPIECSKKADLYGHLLLEGLVEAFGEAICPKDESLKWNEGHMDLVEMGDKRAIVSKGNQGKINWRRKINCSCGLSLMVYIVEQRYGVGSFKTIMLIKRT